MRTVVAAFVIFTASVALAQDDRSRVMGAVTDDSGAALPGVTVTLTGARTLAMVTDGAGRYVTAWVPPGTYTVSFELPGFQTRLVRNVVLAAGHTVVLDQQLPLAPLSETVQVTAPAPPPPPPPAPEPPPRPQIRPVERDGVASVCGPRQSTHFSLAIGRIVQHHGSDRSLLGPGDRLKIDAGESQGLTTGQNLVVRRRFPIGDTNVPKKQLQFGEQTVGLVQILEVERASSVGAVVYACAEIVAGDTVEPYVPLPAFFAVADGKPQFEEPGRITFGDHGRTAGFEGQMMVIDRGIMQGAQRGQRLTIFRRGTNGKLVPFGDGVIVATRADSATILIGHTTDMVTVGDLVALHR